LLVAQPFIQTTVQSKRTKQQRVQTQTPPQQITDVCRLFDQRIIYPSHRGCASPKTFDTPPTPAASRHRGC